MCLLWSKIQILSGLTHITDELKINSLLFSFRRRHWKSCSPSLDTPDSVLVSMKVVLLQSCNSEA